MICIEKLQTDGQINEVSLLWLEMVEELAPKWKPNVEWWRSIADYMLKAGVYEVCMAVDGDKIVGFLDWILFPEPSTGMYHATGQHLYIQKKYRKKDTASKLCRFAMKSMRSRGAEIVDLFCFHDNTDFWVRKGFKPVRAMMRKEMHV